MTPEEQLHILEQQELEKKLKRNKLAKKHRNKKAAQALNISLEEYEAQYDKIEISGTVKDKKIAAQLGISIEAYQVSKIAERLCISIELLKKYLKNEKS